MESDQALRNTRVMQDLCLRQITTAICFFIVKVNSCLLILPSKGKPGLAFTSVRNYEAVCAFQQNRPEIKESFLAGSLDLPELQQEAFVSSYQPEFLTHEPLVDTDLQDLKAPSQCGPMQSSD